MRKSLIAVVTILIVMLLSAPAFAIVVTDLLGDKDGFGLGVKTDNAFDLIAVPNRVSNDITDVRPARNDLPVSWAHEYDLSEFGSLEGVTASLELFTGGQGVNGPSLVQLNGQNIGQLSDGYTEEIGNIARLDIFDLTPFMELLVNGNGRAMISVLTQYSDGTYVESYAPNQNADIWVLDYSELTFRGPSNPTVNPVPEPSTMVLLGVGLFGVAASAKRKRKC